MWGYIDKTGSFVIEPIFLHAHDFVDGLAPASGLDSVRGTIATGFIDKTGSFVTYSPDWKAIKRFGEGLAPVGVETRKTLRLDTYVWGYVDAEGTMQIEPQYEDAAPFSEGLAAVQLRGKWGFIDRTGKVVIKPQFLWPATFEGGVAQVVVDAGYLW